MQTEVLDDRTFGYMTVECDIQPIFATFAVLVLWPLSFDFAAFPRKNENDTGHSELEWIVFFELHSEYLGFSRYETEFELVKGGGIDFLDHVGMASWYDDALDFVLFLILHHYNAS